MPTRVLDSQTVVQVLGPSLATEALFVTFRSYPSGSVLIKTIPTTVFEAGDGGPLIRGLGDAVESILSEGVAIAAAGTAAGVAWPGASPSRVGRATARSKS